MNCTIENGVGLFSFSIDCLPPTVNTVWRHACMKGRSINYMSKQGKKFRQELRACLDEKCTPYLAGVSVNVVLYIPTRRRCDIDNYMKALLDALEGYLYENDEQVMKLNIQKRYRKGQAGTEVTVFPLTDQKV